MFKIIVTIEGVDGSGKTTQATMLVERLLGEGHNAVYIRPIFVLLGLFRREESPISVSPRKNRTKDDSGKSSVIFGVLGYFYALVSYVVIRFQSRNKIVVCDRYFYQFFYDLFESSSENVVKFFPKPDIAFLLKMDLDTLYSRVSSYDAEVDKSYYIKVIGMYSKLASKYEFIQIDAKLEKEAINDVIFGHLAKMLGRTSL
ncbi:MAG: hypothetical protein SVY15_00705 [Halobacteriota archaeon]|nr:hypothetical protein [Halobacteriota archaeon]